MSLILDKIYVSDIQNGDVDFELSRIPSLNRQICVMIFGTNHEDVGTSGYVNCWGLNKKTKGGIGIDFLVENLDEIMPRFEAELDIEMRKIVDRDKDTEQNYEREWHEKQEVKAKRAIKYINSLFEDAWENINNER